MSVQKGHLTIHEKPDETSKSIEVILKAGMLVTRDVEGATKTDKQGNVWCPVVVRSEGWLLLGKKKNLTIPGRMT